ncbi:related to acyl-CoA sterol acyltransferase [Cephalotrichum gorgonifer]|uniref:O-acyltransferase n=1 Tax=Cephalotrichum gorgonifer TaxID=2041049 RepID=A0AAE8SSQ2_9PEZI|nr:related to acyl-CoA sterol acyltransferase [Cephalotrichum gorgonifer]
MATTAADWAAPRDPSLLHPRQRKPHRGVSNGGAGAKPARDRLRDSPEITSSSEPPRYSAPSPSPELPRPGWPPSLSSSTMMLTPARLTSGTSTPIPQDAPPSDHSLFSARKAVRAEQRLLRRRIFPTVDFTSRVSHFDPNSDYTDFHGFYTLFWIGLCILAITTMLRNIRDTGSPMRVQIWALFTEKLGQLALADLLMVATTAADLPMQRLFRSVRPRSAWRWSRAGVAVQSLYQAVWLSAWVAVPFLFDWTWTAQVFFLLHTMTLLMKMHSYAFYNGHLSETERRLRELDNPKTASKAPAYQYPTPEDPDVVRVTSPKRSEFPRERTSPKQEIVGPDGPVGDHHDSAADHGAPGTDEEVENLREDLARELTSPMGNVTYPRNLSWSNYLDFLLCPTLCYELEYPRTPSIDWTALFWKIVATFVCIFLLTVVSEEFILPVLSDASSLLNPADPALAPSTSETLLVLAETVSWLLFPFTVTFLLVFLVIFEYVLGSFAEITRFADRHFYSDWWNSTDWMEFSREWNVPVYSFLRRHVYSASRERMGRSMATIMTFLISAVGHEIVMACITKKIRGYGFVCQMLQLPIVVLQRTKWVRGRETMNNAMFWCSMILGLSTICSLYVLV